MTPCERTDVIAAERARGGHLGEQDEKHLEGCATCRDAVAGAERLAAALGGLAVEEPPADLVARTLARIAVSAAPSPRRQSAVELLGSPIPGLAVPAQRRGRPALRVLLQAAAASLLFLASAGIVAAFYPSVVEALRDDRERACQERLRRVARALRRYRELHPEATTSSPEKRGRKIKEALIVAGLAREEDFACPGARASKRNGDLGYGLRLPEALGHEIVAWDHFDNHRPSVFVAYADGAIAKLDELELAKSILEMAQKKE